MLNLFLSSFYTTYLYKGALYFFVVSVIEKILYTRGSNDKDVNSRGSKMKQKKKTCITAIMAFLILSTVLAIIFMANAALGITLTPTSGAPGDSVTVEGTDFSASSTVGIGFGAEVAVTGEDAGRLQGSGTGPWTGRTKYYPIKPGSFVMQSNVEGVIVDYTDNGNGTLASTSAYFVSGTINYTSGVFSRTSSTDLSAYADTMTHTVSYTCYQYNVTSAAGVPTNSAGAFTTNIIVPNIWNGTHAVAAMDEKGKIATSSFTVFGSPVIPEALTIGAIVSLSSTALIVSFYCLRKRSKSESVA